MVLKPNFLYSVVDNILKHQNYAFSNWEGTTLSSKNGKKVDDFVCFLIKNLLVLVEERTLLMLSHVIKCIQCW